MSRIVECPCVVAERPMCGRKDCWHFGHNKSDCNACRCTGIVRLYSKQGARE
jgi:hypothetical protein